MSDPEIQVALTLPFLKISGKWTVREAEKKAAWELYVELVTRIATVPLDEDAGLLREALSSLHSLFQSAREILRRYGPEVARGKKGTLSFGVVAVAVLNSGIRPFLSKWHPALEDHEARRADDTSRLEHERSWEHAGAMRTDLEALRGTLVCYAEILEQALSLDGDVSLLWNDKQGEDKALPGADGGS